MPVWNCAKQIDPNLPLGNSKQNTPSPNFSGGKESEIKHVKFSLIEKEGLGPEDPFLRGKPQNATPFSTSSDMLAARSDCSSKRTLFWTPVLVQNRSLWGLADTGSCRNLISDLLWVSLPVKLVLRHPGSDIVVAGDGRCLALIGCCVLQFDLVGKTVGH